MPANKLFRAKVSQGAVIPLASAQKEAGIACQEAAKIVGTVSL